MNFKGCETEPEEVRREVLSTGGVPLALRIGGVDGLDASRVQVIEGETSSRAASVV